jgi:ParB-like chromosome segregation protein Spo0J
MKKINLNVIRIDGGTQPRERINMEAVGDYAEAIKVGIEFPAVVVFHDGVEHWLADGFHRYHAHKQAGKASIEADVRSGTQLDAKLYAVGANGAHGLRRSNEDKRRAVQMVLDEPTWHSWSDRKIAEACGVDHKTVAACRAASGEIPQIAAAPVRTVERAGKTFQQDTSRIGKSKPAVETSVATARPTPEREPTTLKPKRTLDNRSAEVEPQTNDDKLAEAQHTISELATENEQLQDRLAVEAMDASEHEKTQASETIRELRALVKTLEAENAALKVSRDTYQREASEAKKSVAYWRKQAEKAGKAAKDSA